MDELKYMKELLREYFDLCLSSLYGLIDLEYDTKMSRFYEVEQELKELSEYED